MNTDALEKKNKNHHALFLRNKNGNTLAGEINKTVQIIRRHFGRYRVNTGHRRK